MPSITTECPRAGRYQSIARIALQMKVVGASPCNIVDVTGISVLVKASVQIEHSAINATRRKLTGILRHLVQDVVSAGRPTLLSSSFDQSHSDPIFTLCHADTGYDPAATEPLIRSARANKNLPIASFLLHRRLGSEPDLVAAPFSCPLPHSPS